MANRRFEMFEIRHILVRMRQGDSDRALARSGLIGRSKAKALRLVAKDRDWLDPVSPLTSGEAGRSVADWAPAMRYTRGLRSLGS